MAFCCCCSKRPYGYDVYEEERERSPLLINVDTPDGNTNRNVKSIPEPSDTALEPLVIHDVRVKHVNKRLQDHAKLFNDHLQKYQRLCQNMEDLSALFPTENTEHSVKGTIRHIRQLCSGSVSLWVIRRPPDMLELVYDGGEAAVHVEPALILFNTASRLAWELLDKGDPLVRAVRLVVDSEKQLRRDMLVASLGEDGPSCNQWLLEGLAQLRAVQGRTSVIKTHVQQHQQLLQQSIQGITERQPELKDKGHTGGSNTKNQEGDAASGDKAESDEPEDADDGLVQMKLSDDTGADGGRGGETQGGDKNQRGSDDNDIER